MNYEIHSEKKNKPRETVQCCGKEIPVGGGEV